MDCQESSLRDMLASPYGAGVGQCILDTVATGENVVIYFDDGNALAITTQMEALQVLKEQFGWGSRSPRVYLAENQMAAHVLGMCQRVERQFTMKEVVARIMDERPEMIMEFAAVWGKLIRDKLIRVCRQGEPTLYEVTLAGGIGL
jgi:hypothetical protein